MKILKFKNYHVQDSQFSLQSWLMSLELERKPSRTRSRFIKMTIENAKEIESQRQQLIAKYGKYTEKKVKDGDKEKIEKELVYVIDPTTGKKTNQIELADPDAYKEELGELLEEEFIIDVTPAVEGTIMAIKDMVINSTAKFSGRIATLYDEWCEAFENIAEAPESKPETTEEEKKEDTAAAQ